jgi:hypothetical protein
MKTRYLIYDATSKTYLGKTPEGREAKGFTRETAHLWEEKEVMPTARLVLGERPRIRREDPTIEEYTSWRGRRGGQAKSARKARTSRRNARNAAKRKKLEQAQSAAA